jgi:hypothetical protein
MALKLWFYDDETVKNNSRDFGCVLATGFIQ